MVKKRKYTKKNKNKKLKWVILALILILILGFVSVKFEVYGKVRAWWQDFNSVDEGEDDDDAEPDPECEKIFSLGQYCNEDPGCCEEGTACARTLIKWECKYLYPVCENVLEHNWELGDEFTYENYKNILSMAERSIDFYDYLNAGNEEDIDYAYEMEQCMSNHPNYIDFCCRCPDGSATRFVWLADEEIHYMWCFPNPT